MREATGREDVAPARDVSPEEAADLVVRIIRAHADSLLRLARRHSLCADDAHDAYQRAMEIFVRRAATLDPEIAAGWVHTVVKHEAMAVRALRLQIVGTQDVDLDRHAADHVPSPEERMLSFDVVTRSAEALQRLKPQEVRALWLKAAGHSYAQIAETTGWTYTKVNRCIAEGRKSFLARYESIESGEECERWAPVVSAMIDGEATAEQVVQVRPHLRNCPACKAMLREADRQRASFAALFPIGMAGSGIATASGGIAAAGHRLEPAPAAETVSQTGGVLGRVYEAVAGAVHERAVASAVKVQAALDAATAGKVAAVAASAAAVAGGGVAAVDQAVVQRDDRPQRAVAHRAPAAATSAVKAAVRHGKTAAPAPADTTAARPARSRSAPAREFGSKSDAESRHVAREFGSSPARASTASSPAPIASAPAPPPRRPGTVDAEFAP